MKPASEKETRFDWPLCHEAEDYILTQLDAFQQRNPMASDLAERMRMETGTLFLDWVDHLVLAPAEQDKLHQVGYREDGAVATEPGYVGWWHPEAMLPRVLV